MKSLQNIQVVVCHIMSKQIGYMLEALYALSVKWAQYLLDK